MRSNRLVIAVSLAATVGCAGNSAADDQALNQAAVQAVQARLDAYAAAAVADKIDQLGDYWTEGAKIYEPESFYEGRAGMMAMVSEAMKTFKVSAATLQMKDTYGHDRGTAVYQYANLDETLTPRDGKAAPTHVRATLAIRWIKGADGAWRMDRMVETPMPPLPAAAKANK